MKSLKNILIAGAVIASTLLPVKLSAQTPLWYDAFSPKNEVVGGLNSYGIPNLNNNNDLKDDLNLILGSSDPRADVDADGDRGTAKDVQVYIEYINGLREYLPGEYWRSTSSEKEEWISKVYPIMTKLNNYTYNTSADPDEFFDSDRFAVGDFLTGNGYNPNRDDFSLIHSKYNLNYNGLFNIPIYIARVHSDDGNFNHGFSVVNKGTNLNDANSWIFLEPQLGKIVEAGSESVPFNSNIVIYGVENFKDAYNLGVIDEPKKTIAVKLHIDSQGNREVTYINPNMIIDQATVGVEDNENTNISEGYSLGNYPNPFNSSTTINYTLPQDGNVSLNIYNLQGKLEKKLVNNKKQLKGNHEIIWDSEKYPAGIYLYQLQTKDFTKTKNMIFLK